MADFDSVYLIPKNISNVNHRSDVKLNSNFYNLYPIISSPMKGVSGKDLIIEMGKNNCLGILHRFMAIVDRQLAIREIYKSNVIYGVAIGINNFEIEFELAKYAVDHNAKMIVCDIANGYISNLMTYGTKLREYFGNEISLMCGNIVTKEGAQHLLNCGFDWARVGVGPGSNCLTRLVTGISRNQLPALKECSSIDINLCIDGGIKESGDIVKSFYYGANAAMLGGMLAHALEAENNGEIYGMASKRNHIENNKEIKSIEGRETKIDNDKKVPLKEILDQILWGIRSACTYLGASSYQEIPHKAKAISANESPL